MRKLFIILACLTGIQALAQNIMRVTLNNGSHIELSTNSVQDMTFYIPVTINITGEWLQYVDQYGGVMECYDFKEDGVLNYKCFYYAYPILNGEVTYTYTVDEKVVTILSDGKPAAAFTIDSFDGISFSTTASTVFYKVQEVYNMNISDSPITIGNSGDIIKYVDKSFVEIENNKIKALKKGSGYALVEDAETKSLKSYRIDIQGETSIVDFSLYFKKSRAEIEAEFGTPDQINGDKYTISYTRTEIGGVPMLTFQFDNTFAHVESVHSYFNNNDDFQPYNKYIEDHYVLNSTYNSRRTYYDTDSEKSASVKITVNEEPDLLTIVYTDLKTTPVSVVDWTQYFKKSGDQIKAEFGDNPSITDDDEEEDYSYLYSKNIGELKRLSFYFTKGFEKVTRVRVTFNDASSMQDYCDNIESKYILYSSNETTKTYYDTNDPTTASVKIMITSYAARSSYFISYSDMSD